jgi:hypothetical protein
MRLSRWTLLLFVVGVLAPLVWAGTQQDLGEYRALAPEKQEQLAKFVAEWRKLDPDASAHLRKVMIRYTDWLSRLPEDQRQSILQAPTSQKKLEIIRNLRERQWLARLPKPDRERVEAAKTDADRQKLLAELRAKEHRRDLGLQLYLVRGEDQQAFNQQLVKLHEEVGPKLRRDERERLAAARKDGWPEYPKTLLELAHKHNVTVPPLVEKRITFLSKYPQINIEKLLAFLKTWEDAAVRDEYMANISGTPNQREEAILELTRIYWELHPFEMKKAQAAEEERRRKQKMGTGK